MGNDSKSVLLELALKSVLNACQDHYNNAETVLSSAEYWKKRFRLTSIQTLDSYVQGLVNAEINKGLTVVDKVASNVKRLLGL